MELHPGEPLIISEIIPFIYFPACRKTKKLNGFPLLFLPVASCILANGGRVLHMKLGRRESRGNTDEAKGMYDMDQDAGED